MANRKETAADIRVSVGDENDVVVERLSLTKDIGVEVTRGSGRTMPEGYGITDVGYEGTMELIGNKKDLESQFFDDNGIPIVLDAITITHIDGSATSYTEIIVTSEGYEMQSEQTTTTSFEFVAMGKDGDNDPSN